MYIVAQHVDAVSSLSGPQSLWPSCCTCILYHAVAQHVDAVTVSVALLLYMYIVPCCSPTCMQCLCTCILYHAVAQHADAVSVSVALLLYMDAEMQVSVALLLYMYIVPCPTCGCRV